MSIVLFKEITTEEALAQLEAEGVKYTGLYVDMEDKKQRKYVKDSAALINGLLKKVDRARIDKSKEFKVNVEAEAKNITARLEEANKPFSLLIDAHNDKRKALLAEEKRIAEAKEAARLAAIAQALRDEHHEMAILLMAEDFRQREALAKQERLDQITRDEAIALEATQKAERKAQAAINEAEEDKQAVIVAAKIAAEKAEADQVALLLKAKNDRRQDMIDDQNRVAAEKKRIEDEAKKRESNKKHKASVNNKALNMLVEYAGLSEVDAKNAVLAIARGNIPAVKISY